MSCIRFDLNSSEERKLALRNAPNLPHSSPEWTESKARRLERMARDTNNVNNRERAALDYHITPKISLLLSLDSTMSVRCALARNERASEDALNRLALDDSETVRGFVALNYSAPAVAIKWLESDPSGLVRYLLSVAEHRVLTE